MPFQISPGVNVTEIDLTTIIPTVSTTDAALVGEFRWGPCETIELISSEDELVKHFGRPDSDNAAVWFSAASFLAYGNKLRLVRAVHRDSNQETDAVNANAVSGALFIANDHEFEVNPPSVIPVGIVGCARFAGALGNKLKLSICPTADAFEKTLTNDSASASTIVQTPTSVRADEIEFGVAPDFISVGSRLTVTFGRTVIRRQIIEKINATTFRLDKAVPSPYIQAAPGGGNAVTFRWEYADFFGVAPGISDYSIAHAGSVKDELHAVVVDGSGKFSGLPGQVIEKYAFLSNLTGAKSADGSNVYYVDAINQRSSFARIVAEIDPLANAPVTEIFLGGSDGTIPDDGDIEQGYDRFANAEIVDIALVITANHSKNIAKYIIENICEYRKDCVAFVSPDFGSVMTSQDPVELVVADRDLLELSSSYGVMDCNWKYQYDKYNDVYRWVPCNGDIAGLCVRTDTERDPWWSPAGLNRGHLKNAIKLAWNPDKAHRDDLYIKGVNPVVSFPAQGIVLWGDKTLLNKPSAFDRINVRRLFIVMEKAISLAARFFLFEFNDEFTRNQFKSMVEPYLRRIKAGRGIYDFKVVCDETNNTGDVIDRNEFVGDIYIKPARSINFIQLNFIAVRTGVAFEEVVGKF